MFRDTAGHEDLTGMIIDCGMRVHEILGPGLLEAVYKACLHIELAAAGLTIDITRRVPIIYRGHHVESHYCPDLIVNDVAIVELKSVERLAPIHTAQLITYLKLTQLRVGLLMNFNVRLFKDGVRRVVRPDLYIRNAAPTGAVTDSPKSN